MRPLTVVRSSVLGYCTGVSRAVAWAIALAENLVAERDAQGGPVKGDTVSSLYTYGPLIHNRTVLRKLEEKQVYVLDGTADMRGAQVIIRAHGVSPDAEAALRKAGAVIRDATCPKVKANQLLARKLCAKGGVTGPVFLAGDRNHAEIQGILGYAPDCVCVSNEAEAEAAARRRGAGENTGRTMPAVLIAQTTFPVDGYRKIAAVLHRYFRLNAQNTICQATTRRQDALRKLCAHVDAVIIAGGKDSANTRALAGIARDRGKPAYLLENAAEVDGIAPELAAYPRIGLASGASTPIETVDELETALLRYAASDKQA
ncbi:MAG: 4-hydroxy-3-methylbut-2-enyl diphosphate reductase [Spirochaetaceae bacterium]|jgi:4-hydroxy-3-methylbut-2-enyl diphosphate reductase|nr:4-hydroxy-3-methylbut-2-enyl diphosphate reductase [Spirochaetaceae bacterium]